MQPCGWLVYGWSWFLSLITGRATSGFWCQMCGVSPWWVPTTLGLLSTSEHLFFIEAGLWAGFRIQGQAFPPFSQNASVSVHVGGLNIY